MKPTALLIALALAGSVLLRADDTSPVFEIPKLDKITIDGNSDDWGDRGFHVDVLSETSLQLRQVGDYYTKFRLGWNDKGLLILMQLNDDITLEEASEDRLASKDSIEIVMALDRGSMQRYQLVLSPGLDPKFSELRFKMYDQRQDETLKKTKLVFDAARTKTPAGCILELLLPWENLGLTAHDGLETALQIVCNDYDGGEDRVQSMWYPATGAQNDTTKMHRIKLGGVSKAVRAAAYANYERFRRTRVNIWTENELIGRTVKIRENGKEIARERVPGAPGQGFLSLALPVPPLGKTFGPLTVLLEGEWVATLKLPDIELLRRDAFQSAEFVFKPFVFSSTAFPHGDFEHPSYVEDLVGPYSVNVTYYDAEYNEVKTASKPGRYGAMVDVKAESGAFLKRYYTLYRQPESFNWRRASIPVTVELPSQLGIDPAVVKEQSGVLGSFFAGRFAESINRDSDSAMLLAGLSELKPGGGKAKQRETPAEKGRQWLFGLKAKTGPIKHNYLLFTPQDYDKDPAKKWPLILFLHGSGERGNDLQKVKVHGPPKLVETTRKDLPFIVVSPQCPNNEWWLPADLIHLLDEVCAKTRVDPDRIYLTGLSMGGYGTWSLIAQYPERFAAIAPICGAGDPEDVERFKNIPAWIFHGTKDQAVPVQRGREMFEALKKVNGRVKYTEYPDADHDSWTRTYANDELYKWFLEQKRGEPAQPPAQ